MCGCKIVFICLLLLPLGLLYAQDNKTATNTTPVAADYTTEEFQPWMLDLRRGEILFFGALPIAFFMVNEVFDMYRFTAKSLEAGQSAELYMFWPKESPNKPPYSIEEKAGLIIGTVSLALLVSVTDYLIGRIRGRNLAGGK